MNAYQLADELQKMFVGEEYDRIVHEIPDLLRQQQAEIDALKAGKIRAYDNGVEDGRKPNTNPVKELTDEEIEDECRKAWGLHDQDQLNLEEVFKFARAILRKVQEADKIESLGTVNIGGVHFRNGKEVK